MGGDLRRDRSGYVLRVESEIVRGVQIDALGIGRRSDRNVGEDAPFGDLFAPRIEVGCLVHVSSGGTRAKCFCC